MKRKIIVAVICFFVLALLLFPVKQYLKDGGTVVYRSLTYSVHKVHAISDGQNGKDYWEGTIIEILGIPVYDDVK